MMFPWISWALFLICDFSLDGFRYVSYTLELQEQPVNWMSQKPLDIDVNVGDCFIKNTTCFTCT